VNCCANTPHRDFNHLRYLKKEAKKDASMEFLQPPGWVRPKGYANGVVAQGRTVYLSGMIGWDGDRQFHCADFAGQVRQALHNTVDVLREAGALPTHIVRMTWYVIDKQEYIAASREIGEAYREIIGRHFPAMTVVQVAGLIEDAARVEIEVTAVLP
jgi:enamine deaminase RidA (YjgF/YER057c/UK114 family)